MSRRPAARGPSPTDDKPSPSNVPTPPIRFAPEKTRVVTPKARRAVPQYEDEDKAFFAKRRREAYSGWMTRMVIRLFVYYTIFSAIFTCGSGPFRYDYSLKDERPVCRTLAQVRTHLLPVVTPIVSKIEETIDPYTGPYVRAATPYVQSVYRVAKPQYDRAYKHGSALYGKHVEPARKRVVNQGHAYADPHVKRAKAEYNKFVQPHLDTLHKSVKPYRDIYERDVSPYVVQAQTYGLAAATTSQKLYVKKAHPRLMALLRLVRAFFTDHFLPAVHRTYVLYIQPQQDKLTLKLFGYLPDRSAEPKPVTYREKVKQAVSDVGQSGKENVAKAAAVVAEQRTQVAEAVQDAASSIMDGASDVVDKVGDAVGAGEDDDEDERGVPDVGENETVEELDRQLDAELDYVTQELESWERGMGRLIGDELEAHRERLQSRSDADGDIDDLADERKASVTILRRYHRKAANVFSKLMEAAKFERSVEDFEGWDTGLGVRVKLFAADLLELEQEFGGHAISEAGDKEAAAEHGQSFVVQTGAGQSVDAGDASSGPTTDEGTDTIVEEADTKQVPTESESDDATSIVSEAVADEPIPLPPADESPSAASVEAESPEAATAGVTPTNEDEPIFSILPTEVQPDNEPAFSILPIEVDEEGNAVTPQSAPQPTPVENANYGGEEDPTFSILPIDVVDEKGTPRDSQHVKHEEL